MIKCGFFDIKSISSNTKKADFNQADIEYLAELILSTDGLICPLIIKQTGIEKGTGILQYTVINGDLEYHAAVRAKEKDIRKAEMVNAFEVTADNQKFAIDQLHLLSGSKPSIVTSSVNIGISIEQLTSIISQQLQPLQQELSNVTRQLEQQRKMFESFGSQSTQSIDLNPQDAKIEEISVETPAKIIEPVAQIELKLDPVPAVTASKTIKKPSDKTKAKTPVKSRAAKPEKSESIAEEPAPKLAKIAAPVAAKSATVKKTTSTAKSKSELDPAIDPIKAANTLHLINTLSPADLLLRMQRSTISSAIKLANNIIDKRNTQPDNKFDSWETIVSEVSGLKAATAATIINKLK